MLILFSSWVRKKYPDEDENPCVPCSGEDEYCSMSVLPYLQDLHYSQRDDEDSDSQEYITEHDLQGSL